MLDLSLRGGVKPSNNATFPDLIRRFFECIQKKCCELSLVNSESTNNKQANDNKVDSQLTTHNSLVKAIAFTLAETLVVMGIIGVVAALTIPNLNQSTGDREKVAKVKKLYSNLEDAFGRATAVYGPYDTWLNGLSTDEEKVTRIGQRITEFMKVSKDCGYNTYSANNTCWSSATGYSIITADGTGMRINEFLIDVDIDGRNKGKNTDGKDAFTFQITGDGIVPWGRDYRTSPLTSCSSYGGSYCTDWVIEMGNMDYLKTNSEGKCPNGKKLDWTTNTSCK